MFNIPKVHRLVKRMCKIIKELLRTLTKVNVLEPNIASTLRSCEDVKYMLHDYQGALEDLDKVDVIEPNNASTLKTCGDVKYMFHDY